MIAAQTLQQALKRKDKELYKNLLEGQTLRRQKLAIVRDIQREEYKAVYTILDKLMDIVSIVWTLPPARILAKNNQNRVATARHCFGYYAQKVLHLPYLEVAAYMERDRSTVYNNIKYWENVIDLPKQYPVEHIQDIEVKHLLKENNIL